MERSELFEEFTRVVALAVTCLLHVFMLQMWLASVTDCHGSVDAHLAHVIVKDTKKDRRGVVILLLIQFTVI